jgi:hypothetical protein
MVNQRDTDAPPQASRIATRFRKPASLLLPGDYVQVHATETALGNRPDEGFARVEHVRVLDKAAAEVMFADPDWHRQVMVLTVRSLQGLLLLSVDDVAVLAFVDPERVASDVGGHVSFGPRSLYGQRKRTGEELRRAEVVDAECRPAVDEAALYPSRYRDEYSRRMALESLTGLREVPLAALPWPHNQTCPLAEFVNADVLSRIGRQAAHATAFLSDEGRRVMASCEYHQADWRLIVRIMHEAVGTPPDFEDIYDKLRGHSKYADLSDQETRFLHSLIEPPIRWGDGSEGLTNGQHRLCALRAAGVTHCYVWGRYLPEADYGQPIDANAHAAAVIRKSDPSG